MTWTVRRLTASDAAASRQLGYEAFGVPATLPTEAATVEAPGRVYYGAFDGDTLAARLADRDFDSWYGGGAIPTSGIAGVTVAVEYRGRRALAPLFARMLAEAKARGAIISTLFPTAPGIYRGFGYELVASFTTVRVPTAALAAVARPGSVTTRRATESDVDAIRGVYDRWAAQQNGPLTRRGVSFNATAAEFLADFTGVTVAVGHSGELCGYVSWSRGQGYGEEAALEISDLIATTADGYRALLAAMGTFVSVTPISTIDTSGDDVAAMMLPSGHWQVVKPRPYMLKLLDVPAALTARRYPRGVAASLPFGLAGDFLAENNGGYLLSVADGAATCDREAVRGGHMFTPQGLALLYAGTQSCANLRFAGQLVGGDPDHDELWDALFGGRQQHIRDYF